MNARRASPADHCDAVIPTSRELLHANLRQDCGRLIWQKRTDHCQTPGYINFALNKRRTSGSQVSLWFGFSDDWIRTE